MDYVLYTQPGEPSSIIDSTENRKEVLNKSLVVCRQKRTQVLQEHPEFLIRDEMKEQRDFIIMQNKTRQAIVNQIQFNELCKNQEQSHFLGKLKLTNKDSSNHIHSLFRWILLIFYKTPPEKYNWHEFKNYVFDRDEGKDLKNRLQLMSLIHMSYWDADKTKYLLSQRVQIMGPFKSNQNLLSQLERLFDVVEVVLKTFEASNRLTKLIEKLVQEKEHITQCAQEIEQLNKSITEVKSNLKQLD